MKYRAKAELYEKDTADKWLRQVLKSTGKDFETSIRMASNPQNKKKTFPMKTKMIFNAVNNQRKPN